jgi:ferredoxin
MMRIKADTGVCAGSVRTESAVSAQDDDGIVVLLTDHPTTRPTAAQARGAVSTNVVGDLGFYARVGDLRRR